VSTHSFGRQVPPELIRLLVAAGADNREKLHAAMREHFAKTANPWNKGQLRTIDTWARLTADCGLIKMVPDGQRVVRCESTEDGMHRVPVFRYVAIIGAVDTSSRPRLRQATWGRDATPATIFEAVSDGAINRFLLADWLNDLLHGVCHAITPIKAETWAQYAGRAGAIQRFAQKAGEDPYIHRPGEYRMRFYRYAPGVLPAPSPIVPQGIDACGDILQLFHLIPAAVPPVGVGRVHLWDTDLEAA
jgi:hypothetical protein